MASRRGPSTPTVAPAVMRSPSGRDQLVSPRSSASMGTPTASTSSAGAALQQQRVADAEHALGGDDGGIERVRGEVQRPRPDVVDAEAPEDDQQLVARRAPEAGQRHALEGAVEAALVGPRRVSGEGLRLRAGALRPGAVGQQGRGPARGVVRGARSERDVLEHRQLARGPGRARRGDRRPRVLALERRQVGDEEGQPRGLLDVGGAGHLGVQAGRVAGQLVQPRRGEGDLVGQTRGVERAAQAGQQLVLVAVVGGAGHAPHAQVAAAGGRPAPRGRRPRRARDRPARLSRLPLLRLARADGAGGFESTVAAEGGHCRLSVLLVAAARLAGLDDVVAGARRLVRIDEAGVEVGGGRIRGGSNW